MSKVRRISIWILIVAVGFGIYWLKNPDSAIPEDNVNYTVLSDVIHKSDNDTSTYQAIKLDNQMTVLLISDPKAIKSLGALALPVGSLHDPKSQQGLAHYTEHMVLMGSERYPEPDGFSEFLSQHAGSYNASTAATRTAYYFEVEHAALPKALDRLADAIAAPLLNPVYADKERNAVNAEMTMARSNDGFRIGQVDAETINQAHPAAMFSGGNLETLRDKDGSKLQNELEHFYKEYYSANLMVGVIYSAEDLSVMAHQAVDTFGRISNKDATVEPITEPAITPDNVGKMITMVPAQAKKVLFIQFPIDNNFSRFTEKSDEYIAYLLSNRSANTLFDTLQKQGLIESVSAGSEPDRYGNSGLFSIYVSLTDQGLEQKDSVIAAIFSYLDLLKQQGISQNYFDEIEKVLTLEFKYPDTYHDMDYVEWVTDQMLIYPLSHILDADYIATDFSPATIKQRLESLVPENSRIWTISPDQPHNRLAYYVEAPYQINDMTQNQLETWFNLKQDFHFTLPELNPYIPDDFSLIVKSKEPDSNNHQFSPTGNQLYIESQYFGNEPKTALMLSLRNNAALNSGKKQVLFQLLDYVASRSMAQLRFQASIAGLSLGTGSDNGLMLRASGFSQHLPDMIRAMLELYQTVPITDSELQLAKSWYLERLDASESVNSYSLSLQPMQALSNPYYTERSERRKLVNQITVNDLLEYRDWLLTQSVPYMLSIGNSSEAQLTALYQDIQTHLSKEVEFQPVAPLTIKDAQQTTIVQKASSSDSALAVVYLPTDYDEINGRAYSILLGRMISPWFFTQLRSDEQLGYAVFSFPTQISQSYGIGFLIQSNQYDPSYLYQRYQAFYPQALDKLNRMTETEFNQYKIALLNELRQPPQTLDEELHLYAGDFINSRFDFSTRDKLIKALDGITQSELVQFYQSAVIEHKSLVIASQVLGQQSNVKAIEQGFVPYLNASELLINLQSK
ncbi:pitrilysin [Zophobihabitans entericus]|uniref:Protease 3 n=1 Tax=Zophobihabitans entericus TaxID=1635327 RepID=A0A6G9I970_9GAMM|nr:pitrilysin [Zophobihabitans entericus]QIQ20763.1 pitrilysin [Zophobihabitans entericus]